MNRLLITEAYREQQAQLHAKGNYGVVGAKHAPAVTTLLTRLSARSLLDYGCGSRQSLRAALSLPPGVLYEGYDPCVPAFSAEPVPAELVVCIDVLEHIEPDLLDNALDHLTNLCDPYGYFSIHTGPAAKTLADGRNAHLIQQPASWWMQKLTERFHVLELREGEGGFSVLLRSRL